MSHLPRETYNVPLDLNLSLS